MPSSPPGPKGPGLAYKTILKPHEMGLRLAPKAYRARLSGFRMIFFSLAQGFNPGWTERQKVYFATAPLFYGLFPIFTQDKFKNALIFNGQILIFERGL